MSTPSSSFNITLLIPASKNDHLYHCQGESVQTNKYRHAIYIDFQLTFLRGHPCAGFEAWREAWCQGAELGKEERMSWNLRTEMMG
jgi:hypothetical protein